MSDGMLHRDDLPMELAEEVTRKLKELYPGMKVMFAGDCPDSAVLVRANQALEALQRKNEESLMNGTCIDCGRQMPGYSTEWREDRGADWAPAEGWVWFSIPQTDEVVSWQCPECNALDEEEGGPSLKKIELDG